LEYHDDHAAAAGGMDDHPPIAADMQAPGDHVGNVQAPGAADVAQPVEDDPDVDLGLG